MPITNIKSSDLKPSFVTKPDMRFGTTFLSNKYRDYAVNGESIMDKATGEIFTKRPEDGRVVSFFQNKKYMYEVMLNLRVLINNNAAFTYPGADANNALYTSTDYDLMSINDNKINNLVENNTEIPNDTDSLVHQLRFRLSQETNGFFIRLTSRDADKTVISWLTTAYNAVCKNYEGTDTDFITEAQKFETIEKWEDSDAVIFYNVTVTKDGTGHTYTCKDYIRINEESCVLLPLINLEQDFPNGYDFVSVEITSFDYDKMHFMLQHKDTLGESFTNELQKYLYPDNNILINYCSICSFVDNSTDINLLGNEFIVALLDVPYVRRFMGKMANLASSSDFILSPTRPTDDMWTVNGVWAEQVRDVFQYGFVIDRDSEVDIHSLETYIAKNQNNINLKISTESYETENMYLWSPDKESYTNEEIDAKIAQLYDYVINRASNVIGESQSEVTDNGVILKTVATTVTDEKEGE